MERIINFYSYEHFESYIKEHSKFISNFPVYDKWTGKSKIIFDFEGGQK